MKQLHNIDFLRLAHPTKNKTLEGISQYSHRTIWWQCDIGHEWEQKVSSHSKSGYDSCVICSGRKVLIGFNDLASKYPEVAKEWHPTKNSYLTKYNITAYSNKRAWWLCSKGHEWESVICSRTNLKRKCPYCSGLLAIEGLNDLATVNPALAKEWHPTKNGTLKPTDVSSNSSKKVWWLSPCGHSWASIISNRNNKNSSCHYCSGHKVLQGFNDLASTHPEVAKEWHPTRNIKSLYEVSRGSELKAWWLCEDGHEWDASVSLRTSQNNACPYCVGRLAVPGVTDLGTLYKDLAKEWDYAKNVNLQLANLRPSSNKKAWWLCSNGHSWQAAIYARKNAGCRKCTSSIRNSKGEKAVKEFVEQLGFEVIQSEYGILPNGEIDLYIPEVNLAIEFNGLYWHSESNGKMQNYHYDKWINCKLKEIELIHIWEDDWSYKAHAVEQLLKNKLIKSRNMVFNSDIIDLGAEDALAFIESNSIRPALLGESNVGIFVDGKLNSVFSFTYSPESRTLDIINFASIINLDKPLNAFIDYMNNAYLLKNITCTTINGSGEEAWFIRLGFHKLFDIAPQFTYLSNGVRATSDKIKNIVIDTNNLPKIWDAGRTVWGKVV